MSSDGGGVGFPMLWFRHILGSPWVSFLYEKRAVSSIIASIITFNMVITTARIMARYNSRNMIAGNSLKSLRWEKYVDCP